MDLTKGVLAGNDADRYTDAKSRIVLAMARQQRDRIEDAQSSLADAAEYVERRLPKIGADGVDRWTEWVAVDVLMREARSLISGPQTAAQLQKIAEEGDALRKLRLQATDEARTGRWKAAAADFAKVQELAPGDPVWYELAVLQLQSGDIPAYRAHTKAVLARLGGTTDPTTARRVSKAALLLPATEPELTQAARLADAALEQDHEWREMTKSLAEYRQGRFASAIEWAEKSLARPTSDRRDTQALLVLAMARQQAGQTNEARAALSKAVTIINTKLPLSGGDLGPAWMDCVIADILLREANRLIEGGPATVGAAK
jgi:tetratricopeptide (TPR) repeat protein